MARIKIEDLPVAENLTPEQEELIEGAGLRSFKPTFEALEARQMMDAGLGRALPSLLAARPTAAPTAAHYREFNAAAFTPGLGNMDLTHSAPARGALPQGQAAAGNTFSTQQDAPFVQSEAEKLVQAKVLNALPSGGWTRPEAKILGSTVVSVKENDIHIEFKVQYNNTPHSTHIGETYTPTTAIGRLNMHFRPAWEGDTRVYKIHDAHHNNFDQGPHVNWQNVRTNLDALCANERITPSDQGTSIKHDANAVKERADKFLVDIIINPSNRWGIHRYGGPDKVEVVGNEIKISFGVHTGTGYGLVHHRVQLNFAICGQYGGETRYALTGAGLHGFQQRGILDNPGAFEGVAKELFNSKVGHIHTSAYDQATVAKSLTSAVQRIGNLKTFEFDGTEGREGGLRVWAKLGDGTRVELNFEYKGHNGAQHVFQLVDVGRDQPGSYWGQDLPNLSQWGHINRDQLKAGCYRLRV
jgi:hypothetical protein